MRPSGLAFAALCLVACAGAVPPPVLRPAQCTGPDDPLALQASATRQSGDRSPGAAAYLGGPEPVIPSALKQGGLDHFVKASFVVGVNGRIEPCSFLVLEASDTAFVPSVYAALAASKFRPAQRDGVAIRSAVSQSYHYSRGAPSSRRPPLAIPLLKPIRGSTPEQRP